MKDRQQGQGKKQDGPQGREQGQQDQDRKQGGLKGREQGQQNQDRQQGGLKGREQRREQGQQNQGRQQGGPTEDGPTEDRQQAGNLSQYLQGCEWPCKPDEIERVAKQNEAPANVLEQIRELPNREFEDQDEFEENFQQTPTTL